MSLVDWPSWTYEKNWSWACTLPEEKIAKVLPAAFHLSRVGMTSSKSGVFRSPVLKPVVHR